MKEREILLTQDEAQARCHYWQRRLNLTEWDIRVEVVRASKLDTAGTLLFGHVQILDTKQIAVVRLLDPGDFQADQGFFDKQNMELTLIHELLHVRLHGMRDANSPEIREQSEERAVHALSLLLEDFDAGQH